jgi:3-methyl-2-oxobutanoate hydroxymethyltransferase
VKQYADVGEAIRHAVEGYCREVREGSFPGPEHGFR